MNYIDLQTLIKMKDRIPFLYLDQCKISCKNNNVIVWDKNGCYYIPVQRVLNFIIGNNCSISTPALFIMYKANAHIHFVKRDGLYYYTPAIGSTYDNKNAEQHANCFVNKKLEIINKMLYLRFKKDFNVSSPEQARGIEGNRVKQFYKEISDKYDITWQGRKFEHGSDLLNEMISLSNIFLYSLCLTIVHSLSYLPDLGFMHSGQRMSFIFDFSDIFKFNFFIPACFEIYSKSGDKKDVEIKFKEIVKINDIIEKMIDILNYLFWDKK